MPHRATPARQEKQRLCLGQHHAHRVFLELFVHQSRSKGKAALPAERANVRTQIHLHALLATKTRIQCKKACHFALSVQAERIQPKRVRQNVTCADLVRAAQLAVIVRTAKLVPSVRQEKRANLVLPALKAATTRRHA
jgi:hypothetical protein